MATPIFCECFYFDLSDGDRVWAVTVDGHFRVSEGGEGHNERGNGELDVSESAMIHAVLNEGKASRFRSRTHEPRMRAANHFKTSSPSVVAVHVVVGRVPVKLS